MNTLNKHEATRLINLEKKLFERFRNGTIDQKIVALDTAVFGLLRYLIEINERPFSACFEADGLKGGYAAAIEADEQFEGFRNAIHGFDEFMQGMVSRLPPDSARLQAHALAEDVVANAKRSAETFGQR